MAKQKPTDITILGPQEAENLEAAMKYLGAGALLIGDIELLYMGITPLVMFPPGDPDSPDQLALLVRIACNQLMIGRMLFTKSVIAVLRQYQGDALMHLRRAIEGCTFTLTCARFGVRPDLMTPSTMPIERRSETVMCTRLKDMRISIRCCRI